LALNIISKKLSHLPKIEDSFIKFAWQLESINEASLMRDWNQHYMNDPSHSPNP